VNGGVEEAGALEEGPRALLCMKCVIPPAERLTTAKTPEEAACLLEARRRKWLRAGGCREGASSPTRAREVA